jgi:hypothetical protein
MANEIQTGDIAAIIKDLMNRRAALDAAITNLVAASGALIPTQDGASFNPSGGADLTPTELPRGAFLGKSIPAAIKFYLTAMKTKQTPKQIATALREGGVESTSDDFEGVLTGSLNRMKANGELLRFKDGWALAEFYPAHLRSSLSNEGASKKKKAKKKTKKTTLKPKAAVSEPSPKPQPRPVTATVPQANVAPPKSIDTRVMELLVFASTPMTAKDAAAALKAQVGVVNFSLVRLAKKGEVRRGEDGRYHLTKEPE